MARKVQPGDGHGDEAGDLIPQVDGADDSKKGKTGTPKKGTPKKGSLAERSAPATPRTPSRRGGRGGVNATSPTTPTAQSTRGSTRKGGQSYTTDVHTAIHVAARHVTDISDIYKGPPAAAFTTLRREGSERFKDLLHHIKNSTSPQFVSRPATLEATLSLVPQQDRAGTEAHKNSPADSAIDVLTPAPSIGQSASDNRQSATNAITMAPVREVSQAERDRLRERNQQVEVVSDSLKDVIHNYYEVQAQVQGYVSETETRDVLINKVGDLSQSLAKLARESSSDTITNTFVPPEVVDYVDDGRNPDIYTRELVEVVQRGNAVLNGKMNAFGTFSKIFADDLRKMGPEMAKAVDEIMGVSGNGGERAEVAVKQENGGSHET